MSIGEDLKKMHYQDWKEREELAKERGRAFWRPEVLERFPNGAHVELDHDNVAYYVDIKGCRRKIESL